MLLLRVESGHDPGERTFDIGNGFLHALAEIASLAFLRRAIEQLDRLTRTRRRTARRCCAAYDTGFEFDFGFHRRIAARIDDFQGSDFDDLRHGAIGTARCGNTW